MPEIQPWTPSKLDAFKGCPRQFEARYVSKVIPYVESPEQAKGNKDHKTLELRQAHGAEKHPLPADMAMHEWYMKELDSWPGVRFTEQKIALDTKGKACAWGVTNVWFKGVIDFLIVNGDTARIVDYKTGKKRPKWDQASAYVLHTFIHHPDVQQVVFEFYWTSTGDRSVQMWTRADIPAMWRTLIPDLKQYKEAFDTNVWQPRQSGLCRQWCDVLSCEFNGKSNP